MTYYLPEGSAECLCASDNLYRTKQMFYRKIETCVFRL